MILGKEISIIWNDKAIQPPIIHATLKEVSVAGIAVVVGERRLFIPYTSMRTCFQSEPQESK